MLTKGRFIAESAPSGGAKDKENPAQAAALAGIIKPVPGRSRFNSAVEANPLASLNPRSACVLSF